MRSLPLGFTGLALLVAAAVLLATLLVPRAARAQSGYTYQECQGVEADAIEAEIEALALSVLQAEGASIDLAAMVARQWQAVGMDAVIAREVDVTVAALMTEAPYWQRFLSGWSAAQAEALTRTVAERTFNSPAVRAGLDELAVGVADELAQELEAAAAASASNGLLCLQEYVGEQYAHTLFELFTREVSAEVEAVDIAAAGTDIGFSAADSHGKALAGAGVIIVSQVVRSVSTKLGQRIAGRVAGRIAGRVLGRLGTSLIPIAGWVIGGGLLIWDVVEGGRGALPQIAEALTSVEMADAMRAEVAVAVREGLDEQLDEMAAEIAAGMVSEWASFCTRHPYLCDLPEESTNFRAVLAATPVDELDKLASLVDVYMTGTGRDALDEALVSGIFESLLALPAESFVILAETASPDVVLAWSALAGPRLPHVVTTGLHQLVTPDELTALEVETLLALQEPTQMAVVTTLPPPMRSAFLTLPVDMLDTLTQRFDSSDLAALAAAAAATGRSLQSVGEEIAAGTLTLDAALAAATATSVAVASAGDDAAARADTDDADSAAAADVGSGGGDDAAARPGAGLTLPGGGQINSVLAAALLLTLLLALSAFALIAVSSVKRYKH